MGGPSHSINPQSPQRLGGYDGARVANGAHLRFGAATRPYDRRPQRGDAARRHAGQVCLRVDVADQNFNLCSRPSCAMENDVFVWNARMLSRLHVLRGHTAPVAGLALSGSLLIT